MSDTPNDRPFRWYATEKMARLEAEIEDLKDDKRVFLSHINLLADLLTPDQAAKARKLLDVTPRMEFLSKALSLQQENAALRAALERLRDCDWVITPQDRMDAVREIARIALENPIGCIATRIRPADQIVQP